MTQKRFRKVQGFIFDNLGDGNKVLDLTEIEDMMNALHNENVELRQDNDIKFWKHQFMTQHNSTQIILHELSLAMADGYEVSDKFKDWLDELKEKNKAVIDKHRRLFE